MAKLNQPDFHIYAFTDGDHLIRIGAAWQNKNGSKGFFLRLKAHPIDGRLLMIPPKSQEEAQQPPEMAEATG